MGLKSEKGLFGKRALGTDIESLIRCGTTCYDIGAVRYVAKATGAESMQGYYRNKADRDTLYAFRFTFKGIRYEAVQNPDPKMYGREK